MTTTAPTSPPRRRGNPTLAAFVGTAIEWYDFYIFGTAAALVFSRVFYPDIAPGAGILASFATLWVGFLFRPIGGIVFGHFGDKYGRKNTLVVTLILMGVATFCIGLLPTFYQIGILAPILLVFFRALQGLAVGGEWGGAVLLATENAKGRKKASAGMWVQQGSPAGSILATVAFLLVGLLPDEQFLSWGWRVPFLFSAVLVVVGLVIRLYVEESAEFSAVQQQKVSAKLPIAEVFQKAPLFVFLGMGASVIGIAAAYFNNTFILSWATTDLDVNRQVMLNILLFAAVLQFILQPVAALVAERVGVAMVMGWGLVWSTVMVAPMFMLVSSGQPILITVGLTLTLLGTVMYYAMLSSFLASVFPANIRYTGVSVAYQLCSSIIGGSTPLIAQWLLLNFGVVGIGLFYGVLLLITLVSVIALARVARSRGIIQDGDATSPTTTF